MIGLEVSTGVKGALGNQIKLRHVSWKSVDLLFV
jgi:hypothetical protein